MTSSVSEAEFLRDTWSPPYSLSETVHPKLRHRVEPIYPERARRARVQGWVILDAVIDRDGGVNDLRVLASPSPDLARASVDAVCCWKYAPALREGKPVAVPFTILVEFKLR